LFNYEIKQVKNCLHYKKNEQRNEWTPIAIDLKISYERVYQIYREYIRTDKIPELKQAGRPKELLSETEINLILNSYSKYYVSASLLSPIIEKEHNIKINHNKIMNFLIKCGKFRTIIFYIGVLLLKILYFKKKALDLLA